MRKLLSVLFSTLQGGVRGGLLFVALFATISLWAYDFQSGDLYYKITSRSAPYTVEVASFNEEAMLTSVEIPRYVTYDDKRYTVTGIGNRAFYRCFSLTSITFPKRGVEVTSIGDDAFDGCSSLASIAIPNSVTSIGSDAFAGCSSLTSITIPNSVTSIGSCAFYGCSSLTSITIGNSVTSIGGSVFSDCISLTSITIPNSVTSIGERAFYKCSSLASITIPSSVTSIGDMAFSWCSSLTSITIPNSVTSIGSYAFLYCTFTKNNFINNSVFNAEASDYWGAEIVDYEIDGLLIRDNTVIGCRPRVTSVTIPNSVTSIGWGAFYDCTSLTSVTIPNSVISIRDEAFQNCMFTIDNFINNSSLNAEANDYWGAKIADYEIDGLLIRNDTVIGCRPLITSAIIPNNVTSIGDGVFFNCDLLTSITIPNSVTSIGNGVIYSCESLMSVTIGNSVKNIGTESFVYCSSLRTVICKAIEVPWTGRDVFGAVPTSEATLYVPAQSLDDYEYTWPWEYFGTILPLEEAPNAVENINTPPPTTNYQKLLRNGQIIILRDGKTYTIMGAEIH